MDTLYCMILTTAGSQEEAEHLAALLVNERLAACVQITAISSTYTWQGALHKEPEWLMMIKTRRDLYLQIEATLHSHHSYEKPEIIQLSITQGSAAYLDWIDEHTQGSRAA